MGGTFKLTVGELPPYKNRISVSPSTRFFLPGICQEPILGKL